MQIKKKIVETNSDNFRRYGSIMKWLEVKKTKPTLSEKYFDWWGKLVTPRFPSGMEMGLFRLKKRGLSMDRMECHQHTPEILLPVDGKFVIPVCCFNREEKGGIPVKNVSAFYLDKDQCMIFKPGIWHGAPFPLKDNRSIIVMFQQGTVENDVEFRALENSSVVLFE